MDNNQNDQTGSGSTIPAEPVQPTPPATDIPSQGEPMPAPAEPQAEPQSVPSEEAPAPESTGQTIASEENCATCGQNQTSCACTPGGPAQEGGAAASGM